MSTFPGRIFRYVFVIIVLGFPAFSATGSCPAHQCFRGRHGNAAQNLSCSDDDSGQTGHADSLLP